jgi:hypothetical protein
LTSTSFVFQAATQKRHGAYVKNPPLRVKFMSLDIGIAFGVYFCNNPATDRNKTAFS